MRLVNFYFVLGIHRGASADDLRKAYLARARATHPDAGGTVERFDATRKAYDVLRDDESRQEWEADYLARAAARRAVVCERCFCAQIESKRGAVCARCGQPWSVGAKREQDRLDRLKSDVLDQLGEAAIAIGSRIGEEIATATIQAVDLGVRKIAEKVRRR